METDNDEGQTVLDEGEGAIITYDGMTQLGLLIPKNQKDGDEVPMIMVFLTAIAIRFHNDEDFVQEQLDWLDARMGGTH